jgi:signal peptidase I
VEKADAKKLLRDYGWAVLAAVLIALVIRFFVIEAYRIPSPAMRPTLEPGDTIFVAKWPFGLRFPGAESAFTGGRPPARGEVVVFTAPGEPGRDYIKRIVGLPGDTVEVAKGKVILNGKELAVAASKNEVCGRERFDDGFEYGVCWEPPILEDSRPERVPEGQVFVVGDARTQTPDGRGRRAWGLVPAQALKGKALWVWLSIEPPGAAANQSGWFSRIRFERMLRRVR